MRRLLMAVTALGGIATAAHGQGADVEAARAKLRQANADYCQAMVAKDAPRLTALYANNASMYPPGEPISSGAQSIGPFIATFMRLPDLNFTTCTASIADLSASGDLGYTLLNFVLSYRGADGRPVNDRARDLLNWKKQADGSWKVVVDIWNSEPPSGPR